MHDPEPLVVVTPLDVLRRAVIPLDAEQQRRQRLDLRVGQRRGCSRRRALRAETRREPCSIGFAHDEFVRVDLAGNNGLTQAPRAVDDQLAGSANRVRRERDAGGHRRNHALDEHADTDGVT